MIEVEIKTLHKGVTTVDEIREFETLELANKFIHMMDEAAFYTEGPDGGTYAELKK